MSSTWRQDMAYAAFDKFDNMIRYMPYALTKDEIRETYIHGYYIKNDMPDVTFKPMANVPMILKLDKFEQGKKTFWWFNPKKETNYPMFPTEFNDMLSKGIDTTLVDGIWTITKRGTGFGLKFVEYY